MWQPSDHKNCSSEEISIQTDGIMSASPQYPETLEGTHQGATSWTTQTERVDTNNRALPSTSTTYELDQFSKNMLIIFNQENFDGYSSPRKGTDKDVEALTNTFKCFSFEVHTYTDLKKDEIMRIMDEVGSKDFTDYGCIAVVVLTHGRANGILKAKDDTYTEVDILIRMQADKNPTLITKPRLLIIQACRGTGTTQAITTKGPKMDSDYTIEKYHLPMESDFMVLHSSFYGKPSFRVPTQGSWFIQTLCNRIDTLAETNDIVSIFTETSRQIAISSGDEEGNNSGIVIYKQMPVLTSTFTRTFYFKKHEIFTNMAPNDGSITREN